MTSSLKRTRIWTGALAGLLTALVWMALSWLGNRLAGLPFAPFDLFDWLVRSLPRGLSEGAIRAMVAAIGWLGVGPLDRAAKLAEQTLALGLMAAVGGLFGLLAAWSAAGHSARVRLRLGCLAASLLLWAGLAWVGGRLPGAVFDWRGLAWQLLLALGWGALLYGALRDRVGADALRSAARRNFLFLAGAALLSLIALAAGLRSGQRVSGGSLTGGVGVVEPDSTSGPAASPAQAELERRSPPAPGTRSEVTPAGSFYRVDINADPPQIEAAAWRLAIDGLVVRPSSFSLDELRAMPQVTQAATLACISNPVGGGLISTCFWTGVRLKDVLEHVGLRPGIQEIFITAADGYSEPVPLVEALDERTLLVYAMNGQPLLREHGFPLRIFIPGHYGMRQPKWITTLHATDTHGLGFWLELSPPKTASAIDSGAKTHSLVVENGTGALGGIAWAAGRGIRKVEVQIDGAAWMVAQLRTPPLSPLTWVQWRYDWKPAPGRHVVRVRATDGTGALQEQQPTNAVGEGATGLDEVTIDV